jgi:hypothetical protein
MNNALRFGMAALALVLIAFVPIVGVAWLAAQLDIILPVWLTCLLAFGLAMLAFEAASRIGPKPFTTPLAKFRQRYPTRRDRLVMLCAVIIGTIIAAYRLPSRLEISWLIEWAFFILGFIVGATICIVFGSKALRNDVTPNAVKRLFKW